MPSSRHLASSLGVLALVMTPSWACVTSEALLKQDPRTRWAASALDVNAKVLFRQDHATQFYTTDPQEVGKKSPLGASFDASHAACTGVDPDEIPNVLADVHNELHEKRIIDDQLLAGAKVWVEKVVKKGGAEVALVARSSDVSLELLVPEVIDADLDGKFKSDAAALSVAMVALQLELSGRARACIEATLCRPNPEGTAPRKVQYVESLYYGALLRLNFKNQELEVKGRVKETSQFGVEFSAKGSNLRLDGTTLGLVDSSKVSVPKILRWLRDEQDTLKVHDYLDQAAKSFEVVAVRFSEVECQVLE